MDTATKQRLDELMPWYVAGNVDAQDRAWLEQVISEHAEARAALRWHRSVQQAIRADVGLKRLLDRVHAEGKARPSWLARIAEFWGRLATGPAFAVAAAVLVVQACIIGVLLSHEEGPTEFGQTRSLALHAVLPGPVLQVTFKPDATERDMRLLLVKIAGRVIDGPGQLGDYIVAVPARQIEPARRQRPGG